MQLLGVDVDIAGEDVLGDDGLDQGGLVVLLLVVGLGAGDGHGQHGAEAGGQLVGALHEHGVLDVLLGTRHRPEGLARVHGDLLTRLGEDTGRVRDMGAHDGEFTGGNNVSLAVYNAKRSGGGFLHLYDHALKNSAGHGDPSIFS